MRPTVVLLHGFTQTGASWERVAVALGERYLPLAPDIRGHGAASTATPVTIESVIDDISRLAPESFVLAGYSMGGRIALHIALALGERVRRLVLISASPGIADAAERARRRAGDERLAEAIERSTIEQFARRWALTPVLVDQPPQIQAAAHSDRLLSTPPGLARALRALGTGALAPLWDRLAEVPAPATLIAGQRDRKFTAIAEQMAHRLPRAELEIVAGAGHAVHLEAPERVAAIIARGPD
jgi:2-succinyl-6-hydroxy-2,4-cyclohexadiene-1-carboxylate synthase